MKKDNLKLLIQNYNEGSDFIENNIKPKDIVDLDDEHKYVDKNYKGYNFTLYLKKVTLDEAIDNLCEEDNTPENQELAVKLRQNSSSIKENSEIFSSFAFMTYTFQGKNYYLFETGDGENHSISQDVISAYQQEHPDMTLEKATHTFLSRSEISDDTFSINGIAKDGTHVKMDLREVYVPLNNDDFHGWLSYKCIGDDFYVYNELYDD